MINEVRRAALIGVLATATTFGCGGPSACDTAIADAAVARATHVELQTRLDVVEMDATKAYEAEVDSIGADAQLNDQLSDRTMELLLSELRSEWVAQMDEIAASPLAAATFEAGVEIEVAEAAKAAVCEEAMS